MTDDGIRIDTFRDAYAADFARLNRDWLVGFGLYEPIDGEYLDDPRGHFLDRGGEIFCALRGDEVVGTCAILPSADGVCELSKLTVAPAARGAGLGRRLSETAIAHARSLGASRIVLSSNAQLRTAVALYEQLGFRHVAPGSGISYENADVFMALDL